jgi:O-succinylbenzoic acid--CoA ligase
LNGIQYSEKSLVAFAKKTLLHGEEHEKDIAHFIIDWFSAFTEIKVQTSGSTGKPKKIILQKKAMIASAVATGNYFNLQAKQTALLCLSANYIAGKMMLVRALVLGLHLDTVAPSSSPLENSKKIYNFCAMVPLQASHSLDNLTKIDILIIGGAPLSYVLNEALKLIDHVAVYETYGMTETISHIALKNIKQEWFECLPNINISSSDDNCLVIDAPRITSEKLFTTDIVKIAGNKFIWLGRRDNIINSGGIKIFPEQIEHILSSQIVENFYISSKKDSVLGEKVVLIIESESNKTINFSELEKYQIPKEIICLSEFERTETGKIKRQKF